MGNTLQGSFVRNYRGASGLLSCHVEEWKRGHVVSESGPTHGLPPRRMDDTQHGRDCAEKQKLIAATHESQTCGRTALKADEETTAAKSSDTLLLQ